ncbi:hypothetical protein [Paracoccus aerodenitrificans]|uniref:hypothetical protein n=1 Tax=Paracoccus aerodenitrificans TaxID=3017781 RepID=UPI0022F054F3|nr:hypothetical protein [Paracoccus aerodenitrificans]WBU63558.1 hypothetical protein PAE61_14545 [Paracoccus aerodenitrificans]
MTLRLRIFLTGFPALFMAAIVTLAPSPSTSSAAQEYYSSTLAGTTLSDQEQRERAYSLGIVAGTLFSGSDVGNVYAGGNIAHCRGLRITGS